MISIRSALLLIVLAAFARAQTASYAFFGSDCQFPVWLPARLQNLSLPRIGQTLTIETRSASGGPSNLILLTGLSRTHWNGLTLPFDTRGLSSTNVIFCGTLYVSPDILTVSPIFLPGDSRRVDIPIPNSTALLGARFYQQVVEHYDRAISDLVFFTHAAEARIGL